MPAAFAQDAPPATQRVEITGSSIRRIDADGDGLLDPKEAEAATAVGDRR